MVPRDTNRRSQQLIPFFAFLQISANLTTHGGMRELANSALAAFHDNHEQSAGATGHTPRATNVAQSYIRMAIVGKCRRISGCLSKQQNNAWGG